MLKVRRPVVIFSNGLGDHLVNLPALRALASLFPGRLALICETGAHQTFFSGLHFRDVCEVEMEISGKGKLFDAETVAARLAPCDLLLSLNPWHSPSVDRLMELFRHPPSIGFFPPFDTTLERDFSKHSAKLAFDVPLTLDASLRIEDFTAPPEIPREFQRQAERILNSLPANARVLTLHVDTQPEKMWPRPKFHRLLDRFLTRHPHFHALILGLDDQGLEQALASDRVISYCNEVPKATALSLVSKSSLFLGVDSFFLHAADLFRIPGVALFGPTDPVEWGFLVAPGKHISANGSMKAVKVNDVLSAMESVLEEEKLRSASA